MTLTVSTGDHPTTSQADFPKSHIGLPSSLYNPSETSHEKTAESLEPPGTELLASVLSATQLTDLGAVHGMKVGFPRASVELRNAEEKELPYTPYRRISAPAEAAKQKPWLRKMVCGG